MSRPGRTQDLTSTVVGAGAPVAPRLPEAERYTLLEELGAGAMGVVYAAYDATLDRKVALKLLREHLLGGAHQDRLLREARALAQLSHPNVVPVYDVGETAGRIFFAMEFVRGQTVAAWAAQPRAVGEILEVVRAAAAGLAAAHAAGLVHRDIKPSNLLIGEDGRVRVADFGLAHEGAPPAASEGAAVATGFAGSPAYMAPEQLRCARADARSDQFALCVTAYELLAGQRPFAGETIDAQLAAIEVGPAPLPRAVPAWASAAIRRGLAADPAARFPDVGALRDALAAPRRRWGWIAAAGTAALVAGAVVVARAGDRGDDARASCARAAAAIDTTWHPARRTTLVAHLARASGAAELPARIAAQLDAYATQWRTQQTSTCHAARVDHAWSAELATRAGRCLDDQRAALERTLRALTAAGEAPSGTAARAAVARLRGARVCGDPDYLRSAVDVAVAPALRAQVDALDAEVEDLALAQALGREAEVERALPALRARAAELGYAPAQAQLAIIEADIARDRGDLVTAARLHTAAYVAARAARAPVPATQAAASLIWDHGLIGEDVARAGDWAEVARAESASLDDHDVGVAVHYALGALADRRGDVALAITEFERAAELAEREYGTDHYITATMQIAVASMLGAAGRHNKALAPHRAAIAVIERWEGANARGLISALDNLALTESSAGLHADAEAHARRALAIAEQVADAERLGTALLNLGTVLVNAGTPDGALPLFDRAEAQFTSARLAAGAASARVQRGIAATPAAVTSRDAAAIVRVRADLVDGRAALAAAFGEDDVQVAEADAALADLLGQLGRCGEAAPLAARAGAAYDRVNAPPSQRRLVTAALARCE